MIILSESHQQSLISRHDRQFMTEMAKLFGFPVYPIRAGREEGETAENVLSAVPSQSRETEAIWLGDVPTLEWYGAVEEAALQKGIRLVNTLEQHLRVQQFDRAYLHLKELVPESVILTPLEQCEEAIDPLELPFHQKRDVIVHQDVKLRHSRLASDGSPLGRKYRVFVYQQQVLTYGYFWQGSDPLQYLSMPEEDQLLELALKAADRLDVPFVAIDIGQQEDETWTILATGDAQFSSAGQVPILQLWNRLREIKNP